MIGWSTIFARSASLSVLWIALFADGVSLGDDELLSQSSGLASSLTGNDPTSTPQLPALKPVIGQRRVSLWATYYSIPRVRSVGRGGIPLTTAGGQIIGPRLSPRDFCAAAMGGTVEVILRNGRPRMFAFAGLAEEPAVDCTPFYRGFQALGRTQFRSTHVPIGSGRSRLVPFRSIAVDTRFMSPGTVLYVPEARGSVVTAPSGQTWIHDGYFYAADTGGAIDGNHIDVFIGFSPYNPFIFVKSRPDAKFYAYVVKDRAIIRAVERMGDGDSGAL